MKDQEQYEMFQPYQGRKIKKHKSIKSISCRFFLAYAIGMCIYITVRIIISIR